jgi:hypothetical protein
MNRQMIKYGLGGAALLLLVFGAVYLWPDVKRYIRISTM